jgi:hypothetical protein
MRGIYSLVGNQLPWTESGKCTPELLGNNTMCRGKWRRSSLFLLDMSHASFDAAKKVIRVNPPAFAMSEHAVHQGGTVMMQVISLGRIGYNFYKSDSEFVSRPAEYFEGAMKLTLFGFSIEDMTGYQYRVTAEDVKGDGSMVRRYTWAPQAPLTPAPKEEAMEDFTYDLVRVMDDKGKIVNPGAIKEMKSIYGENVVILAPGLPQDVKMDVVVPLVALYKIFMGYIAPHM